MYIENLNFTLFLEEKKRKRKNRELRDWGSSFSNSA